MTCKDCLHYEACKGTYFTFKQMIDKDSFDNEHYADVYNCPDFTDRSEWVHLPCKVGDIAWYITGIHHSLIKSAKVEEIIINETGIRELYVSTENGCYFQNDITTFYLTREAAEKALEEKK